MEKEEFMRDFREFFERDVWARKLNLEELLFLREKYWGAAGPFNRAAREVCDRLIEEKISRLGFRMSEKTGPPRVEFDSGREGNFYFLGAGWTWEEISQKSETIKTLIRQGRGPHECAAGMTKDLSLSSQGMTLEKGKALAEKIFAPRGEEPSPQEAPDRGPAPGR